MNTILKGLNEIDESEMCQVSGGAVGDIFYGATDTLIGSLTLVSNTVAGAATAAQPLLNGASGTLDSVTGVVNSATGSLIP